MVALVSIALYLLVNKGTKTEQVPYVVFPASLQDAAAFIPKDYTSQSKSLFCTPNLDASVFASFYLGIREAHCGEELLCGSMGGAHQVDQRILD